MIPAIIAAVSGVAELFSAAKSAYETVTGSPSAATSPEALQAEVEALPEDKRAAWAAAVQAEVARYEAETKRLTVEEGELTPELMQAIGPDAAARIAVMRMTARPKIALSMSRVVLLPFYLIVVDAAISLVNILLGGLGSTVRFETLAKVMLNGKAEDSVYAVMYSEAVQPAVVVILGFMLLRHLQKTATGSDGAGLGQQIGGLVNQVAGLFTKRGKP